jgi:hypothetical protein
MHNKTRPVLGPHRTHHPALDVEGLIVKGRARAKHGPRRKGHGHALANALAHADAIEHGHGSGSSVSHGLGRTIPRRSASD